MTDHYQPPEAEVEEFFVRRLHALMAEAVTKLHAEQPVIGLVVAEQLHRGPAGVS